MNTYRRKRWLRRCRHCREPYSTRAGRGLCITCWRDKAVRVAYPVVAPMPWEAKT